MDTKDFEVEELIPLAEAIERGYGSYSKLYRLVKAGKLQSIRNGKLIYFRKQDLDALFQIQTVTEEQILNRLYEDLEANVNSLSVDGKKKLMGLLMESLEHDREKRSVHGQ